MVSEQGVVAARPGASPGRRRWPRWPPRHRRPPGENRSTTAMRGVDPGRRSAVVSPAAAWPARRPARSTAADQQREAAQPHADARQVDEVGGERQRRPGRPRPAWPVRLTVTRSASRPAAATTRRPGRRPRRASRGRTAAATAERATQAQPPTSAARCGVPSSSATTSGRRRRPACRRPRRRPAAGCTARWRPRVTAPGRAPRGAGPGGRRHPPATARRGTPTDPRARRRRRRPTNRTTPNDDAERRGRRSARPAEHVVDQRLVVGRRRRRPRPPGR